MVAVPAREGAPAFPGAQGPMIAARDALARLSAPRKKTEAEQRLDEILRDLHSQRSQAAKEAARRKLEQIKAKLEALKLAAGSAAATGDARLARKVAKEIRDAARELGRALAEAGGSGSAGAAASAGVATAKADAAAGRETAVPGAAKTAGEQIRSAASGDDLAALKGEAAGVLREFKKIMRKLRVTALHPHLDRKDRIEMDRMFAEADRELAALQAAAAPSPGMTVNITA